MSRSKVNYKTILHYYWLQVRKHLGYFLLVFFGYGIGIILADIINPLWYRNIIDALSSNVPKDIAWLEIVRMLIYIFTTIISFNVFFRIGDYAISRSQSNIMRDLANFAFQKLTRHSYKFFANNFSGSLVTKVKRFVRSFEDIQDQISFAFWMTTTQITGSLITLLIIAPWLALLFVVWLAIYIPTAVYLTWRKIPLDEAEANADSAVTGRLADVITNILNIKIFSSRWREVKSFAKVTEEERKKRFKAWLFGTRIWLIQSFLLGIFEIAGISVALYFWRIDLISAGTVVLVQIYIGVMWHNLWNLGNALSKISKAFANAEEMVEIFEKPISIHDPLVAQKLRITKGQIDIRKISFRYGKDTSKVFSSFSLEIPAGQRVGLVGHSGAGKSTITKLLLRFADVEKGFILIDDQDITQITQDDLRSKISYVPQDPILFHRSLRDNIAYGNPKAAEKDIIEAAKKAHAHEFISKFPKGYDTLVGERGVKLSGGERQRIAIARAMLKDAPVLILDEATSSLDAVSEKYIQEAFKKLMHGRTTIVIAHRLSTIQNLDRIVVIEKGKIVEDGTHTELLKNKGTYANFWQHQTSGFIE